MPDKTVRFRADSPLSYSLAVISLVEHARSTQQEFTFGPLTVEGLTQGGLVVTGPDLGEVEELLAGIPGLVASDA